MLEVAAVIRMSEKKAGTRNTKQRLHTKQRLLKLDK